MQAGARHEGEKMIELLRRNASTKTDHHFGQKGLTLGMVAFVNLTPLENVTWLQTVARVYTQKNSLSQTCLSHTVNLTNLHFSSTCTQ